LEVVFSQVYHSIADLYVYFLAQGVRNLTVGGLLGFITANKWLRSDYAAPLRTYLRDEAAPVQLLDFGHSNVFPGTDTFPCIVIVSSPVDRSPDRERLLFADVSDRVRGDMPFHTYMQQRGFEVPFSNLRRTGWMLEPAGVSELLEKLRTQFPTLGERGGIDALRGILTGLNAAFYVDTPTRDRLVEENPECQPLVRKLLRGRTIGRWRPAWDGEWMIAIPSSNNQDWPWSDSKDQRKAEDIFRQAYPSLYSHLKKFESQLRPRQDQGRFWWELRSCDYYEALDRPKIVAKRIMYHSSFCQDFESYWVNDSAIFLNTSDSYLLAILNSRVIWWYIFRLWPHMKDEALRAQNRRLLSVPIPEASDDLRLKIEKLVGQAYKVAGQEDKLSDLLNIEAEIQDCVVEAYGLTSAEIALIHRTLPLRDPLVVLEGRLRQSQYLLLA